MNGRIVLETSPLTAFEILICKTAFLGFRGWRFSDRRRFQVGPPEKERFSTHVRTPDRMLGCSPPPNDSDLDGVGSCGGDGNHSDYTIEVKLISMFTVTPNLPAGLPIRGNGT